MDINELEKPYFGAIKHIAASSNVLSITHGLLPYQGYKVLNSSSTSWIQNRNGLQLVVCAQSTREVALYIKSFNLKKRDVLIAGIPRHHPDWMRHFSSITGHSTPIDGKDTILLVSRPGGSSYLPSDRKRINVETLREFADQHNLKILIKRHPKEKHERVFEQVLKKNNRGVKWDFTESHALEASPNIIFAVTFFSGVVLDLLQRGIPTIELLDLRELPDWDHKLVSRDILGHPIIEYREFGLVIGATTKQEFFAAAQAVMVETAATLEKLRLSYVENYRYPPLSAAQVVDKIKL